MKKSNEMSSFCIRGMMCVLPLVFSCILRGFNITIEADVKIIMRLCLCAVTVYGAFLMYKGKLSAEKAVTLIILAGIIVRSCYTIYTGPFTRGHDVGSDSPNSTGHWGYIYHVMNFDLPPSNDYQFYQQPFYYILSSVFIKVAMMFTDVTEWEELTYMAQIVSCIGSSVSLVFLSETMKKLDIPHRVHIVAVALAAFYPVQILAAGRLNNDTLVATFMVLSLYFTAAWHKERKISNMIGIALSIGFGMMTKINCGMVALITGPVMLYHLICAIREKDNAQIKKLVIQFAVFALICFPLALWYPIRNYIKFGQTLTYICYVAEGSGVYRGYLPWTERWLTLPFTKFIENPYMNMASDASIPMSIIKTGVHGEFTYGNLSKVLAWGLDYIHTIVLIMVFINVAFTAFANKSLTRLQKLPVLAMWLINTVSYIQFNIMYPSICTADFRYLLVWQFVSGVCVAYFMDYCSKNRDKKGYKYILNVQTIIVSLFCVCSIMHFC